MSGDSRTPLSTPDTSAGVRTAKILGLVYDLAVVAIAGSAMIFLFAGIDAGLYASGGLGLAVSFTLGFVSLRRNLVSLGSGVVRYGKLWVWMMVFSAVSLVTGKWEPLVFFATAGVGMTLCYTLGGWLGSRAAK